MEPIVFEHSDKNIPVPDRRTFCKMFINAVEIFDKNLRWAAHFYLNPNEVPPEKNWYGFKSNNPPPQVKELKFFEEDLLKMTQRLEFKPRTNEFMAVLNEDIEKIGNTDKVIVNADKTNNKYLIGKTEYQKMLEKNINADYKKEDIRNVDEVIVEHKKVVTKLGLEERVFKTTSRTAFITVKDHKENYQNDTKCRLLNPTKPEIGRISKKILENVINVIKQKSKLRQWKNTDSVINWFKQIKNKKRKSFIQFDICNYYSSITPELLSKALDWAEMYVTITPEERNTIMQSKKSFLYTGDTPWVKKGDTNFDNAMGAWDGAEVCDIIGLFLLDQLANRIAGLEIGKYRDDGLGVAETTARNMEKMRQKIVQVYGDFGLKITSTANLKVVTFLDVNLDLTNECFKPFMKPGDRPLYVNSKSNHPPSIIKNIPFAVNRRLSSISSSKEIFDAAAPIYQAELQRAGYKHKLEYNEQQAPKRKRRRKIIWFNPPYSMDLKTNIGQKFLRLIDKHFPRGSILYPLINRYKVKLSYRCVPNMGAKISNHNSKLLREKPVECGCNCQQPEECPMPGKCTTDKLVYRASITANNKVETYVGLTAGTFKKRYGSHKHDFLNRPTENRTSTTLSSYIWKLKDDNKAYQVEFDIVKRAAPFSPLPGTCKLCTEEKFV